MSDTLELESVTVSRGAGPVISDVSLTLRQGEVLALVGPNGAGKTSLIEAGEGEVLALVGPNGAGKTSLIEAISGVIGHSAGTIRLGGESIDRVSRVNRARRGIVHIEQGRAVFPTLTVRENLSLTARTPAEVDAAIAQFPELEKRIDAPTQLLSGGEQQMVVLARAFAAKPKFLLIDEMSLGLAPVVFTRLFPMVATLAEHGAGVLLVEQFTELALGLASDAIVVATGHVTYQGDAATLKADPAVLHRAYLGS